MKQFSLEEYLKNPSRKVVTRKGNPVKIMCTNYYLSSYPIVAEIPSRWEKITSFSFTEDGKKQRGLEDEDDLFFAPEKHEGWINVYKEYKEIKEKGEELRGAHIYSSKEEALRAGKLFDGYVATAKIEWED